MKVTKKEKLNRFFFFFFFFKSLFDKLGDNLSVII